MKTRTWTMMALALALGAATLPKAQAGRTILWIDDATGDVAQNVTFSGTIDLSGAAALTLDDGGLDDIAALAMTDSNIIVGSGTAWVAESGATARTSLGLAIGTDVLAQQTIGIANDNLLEVDDASVAAGDYGKFTANGLEGRTYAEVKTDLSLDNVENTALSTWAGTASVTTLGTIATGTWQGTAIDHERGGLEANVSAYNGLVRISGGATSAVSVDDSTIEIATSTMQLKNGGVTVAKLATAARLQTAVVTVATPTAAPTGSNILNQDAVWGWVAPADVTVVSAYVSCDTAISAGDATNHYELNLYDATGAAELLAANVSLVAGVAQYAATLVTTDQNADLAAGDEVVLRIDQLDDGGAGPDDLSAATWKVQINYRLR